MLRFFSSQRTNSNILTAEYLRAKEEHNTAAASYLLRRIIEIDPNNKAAIIESALLEAQERAARPEHQSTEVPSKDKPTSVLVK